VQDVEHFDKSDGSRPFQITNGADGVRPHAAQAKPGANAKDRLYKYTSTVVLLNLTGTPYSTRCPFPRAAQKPEEGPAKQ
jgi:hypothetical protein